MLILSPTNRVSTSYVPVDQIPFLLPAYRSVSGLGLELEPMTLAFGMGALVLAFYLFGFQTRPKYEAAKRKRREGQIKKLRDQIKALEAKD